MAEIETDPKRVAAQAAMMKLLGAKPEPIIAMFDRLEIPWERVKIDGEIVFQMKWGDLMTAERRLQSEETFMEKMAKELKDQYGNDIQEMTAQNANG